MIEPVLEIARAIAAASGRAVVVGGYVRDLFLELHARDADITVNAVDIDTVESSVDPKDIDIEVHGLDLEGLDAVLSRFGGVIQVGRSFGVLMIKGLPVDFSLPRRDQKVAPGHKGFAVVCDPELDFTEASRRRDLTINSMGLDPLTGEIFDPHGGRRDLVRGVLRATDREHFSEDPLRGVRVAQLAARFDMQPDDELKELCAALDLSELAAERLYEEIRKLLLKGKRPSVGFELLGETGLIRFFPELAALIDVPQDATWHPEGTVWTHTMMVVDQAARLRRGDDEDLVLMLAALCHDLGKPATTVEEGGRIRSLEHGAVGVGPTRAFLTALRAPNVVMDEVCALVEHHLAPALFIKNNAGPRGYRRLARQLDEVGVSLELLERVARADHLGRDTEEARAGRFPAGDQFLATAAELLVEEKGPRDVVMGRHLIARGLEPGPAFGEILARCREVQDETGWEDAGRILDRVLG